MHRYVAHDAGVSVQLTTTDAMWAVADIGKLHLLSLGDPTTW